MPPVAPIERHPSSTLSQLATLLARKELLLKRTRPITTICELLLPALLCALLILGVSLSNLESAPDRLYAPPNLTAAYASLSPAAVAPLFLSNFVSGALAQSSLPPPLGVPPLGLYLAYAYWISALRPSKPLAPFDGTFLAFAAAPPASLDDAARLIDLAVNGSLASLRAALDAHPLLRSQIEAELAELPFPLPLDVFLDVPRVEMRAFASTDALEQAAEDNAPIWASVVFDSIPRDGVGNWSYQLRFNSSSVPSSKRTFDKFASGLSTKFYTYYSSGFLSLQSAINSHIYANQSGVDPAAAAAALPPFGVPFPTAAYTHNVFFNFAGNLVGLVVVFSTLIPLSTMLRSLVLEKESKLREELLMMGTALPAYYASILLTYGASFVATALIGAAEIGFSCYTHSSPTLVLLLFVLFALASLAFTLAMTPFFTNARLAALLGPLLFFLSSQLYNLFLDQGELADGRVGAKSAVSLLPAMAFYLGASLMTQYEGSQQGITWSTVHEGEFPLSASLAFLFFDIILWLCLAWYFDQVVPSEYGLQRKPWFLLQPSYWCGGGTSSCSGAPLLATASASEETMVVEPLPQPVGDAGVRTAGLRKVWPRGVAVHSLDLEMCAGQITALLGANGAGKTTTISMLTGLIAPSAGDARIDGKSITSQMAQIRLSLGVCPQVNVIFESLTPTQHLRLYGALKGLFGAALHEAVEQMLEQVKLSERKHTPAGALSGGQKRKLCLGIALMGGSRTIFLDEPTSGMDPHSRRAIWGLLREQREGRTLVLTTHFLDEAELLSDRIAIMAEGRLCCVGSALFLKAHFGVGYSLSLVKASSAAFNGAKVLEFIKRYAPHGRIISDNRIEAVVQLPGDDLAQLQKLLLALEASLAALGVKEYGATCTTLEDVFLKINEAALERLARQEHEREAGELAVPMLTELPAAKPQPDAHSVTIAPPLPPPPPPPSRASALGTYRSLVVKRALSARRDCCTTTCQLLFPVVLIFLALSILNISSRIVDTGPAIELTPAGVFLSSAWSGPAVPRPVPLLLADDNATLALSANLREQGWAPAANVSNCSEEFPLAAVELSEHLLAHRSSEVVGAITENASLLSALLFNASAIHSLPALVNSLYDARVAIASGNQSFIHAVSKDLPLSKDRKAKIASFVSVFASIMILIPFAFVAATFVTPLLRERESGSKQMQFVSGVKGLTYWLSSWSWDTLMYILVLACSLLVFAIARRDEFTGSTEAFGATALTLALFGFATLPLSSAASFLFKSPSNGLIVLITFHFLTGFGLVIADFILSEIDDTKDVSKYLKWLYRLFPAYCLGSSFYSLSTRQVFVQAGQASGPLYGFSCSSNGLFCPLGAPLLYLFLEGVFFICLTLLLQAAASHTALLSRCSSPFGALLARLGFRAAATPLITTLPLDADAAALPPLPSGRELEDDAVADERRAIDGGDASGQLVLRHLHKVYGGEGGKTAVRDLCLRIQTGECFGFLGVNGAGKSTTFSMLTGAVQPTSGDALLNGMSILTDQDAIRRQVGYCPQHDALENLMTGRETLRMYASIKQVPRELIDAEVDGLLADLDLLKFADKPAGQYSGGNKRKLCVGIALVGGPQLVLLDEPSSGMDAASKRFLWTVIRRRTANCCTVLTTHSMEECEALCGRIGVMVDGSLRCLGPIQTLKTLYGQGYKIDLRLDVERSNAQEVLDFLQQCCGGTAKLEELEPPVMTLTVPSDAARLPDLMGRLAEAREVHHVHECSVTQCSLEQIFLLMASKSKLRASI
ncbi:hypothetical protein AB1Y20_011923 [Prymnesium parvum]|uniref:ABC transporter domain-containing protein n=1 Tax=Prymnesium parvum TaxID=97485 RepID=A0AB34IMZ4_PRYPA